MTQRKPFQIASAVFVVLMLFAYPSFTGTKGYLKIATQKWPVFVAISLLFLLSQAILLILEKDKRALRNTVKKLDTPELLLLGYLGFTLLSAVFSHYKWIEGVGSVWLGYGRHDGVLTVAIYVLTTLCICFFAKFQNWYLYVGGAFLFFQGVLCTLQLMGLNPLWLYPANTMGYYGGDGVFYSGQYIGTIGNVDLMAAIFCLLIPLAVAYFVRSKDKLSWLLLASACVGLFAARLMWVLACIVGLAVALVVSFPVLCKDEKCTKKAFLAYACLFATVGASYLFVLKRGFVFAPSKIAYVSFALAVVFLALSFVSFSPKKLRKALWIFLAVGILLCLLLLYFVPFQDGMLYELHEILHGRIQDSFGTSRIYIWHNVLERIQSLPHLLLGTGPDTMQYALGLKFYRHNAAGEVIKTAAIDAAHNEYLNILSNQGLFALICYLGALVYCAVLWLKKQKHDGICVAGCAVLGYCVQGFFGFSQYITTPMFWLVFGFFLQFSKEDIE